MTDADPYQMLSPETLAARLGQVAAVTQQVGADTSQWQIDEVSDGDLNLVFIVSGPGGRVVVKQAMPYIRAIGESAPLPVERISQEHQALIRQGQRAPGSVPDVLHLDAAQALLVMDYLAPPYVTLRQRLIAGEQVDGLAPFLGTFLARTGFRGSELSMDQADKQADAALFSRTVAVASLTQGDVFTEAYLPGEGAAHTPGIEPVVKQLQSDPVLKQRAQEMLMRFVTNSETLLHGDLHTGSIMTTDKAARVIDPEFAQYGPFGFDLGMLVGHLLAAYFSQTAHRDEAALKPYQDWILSTITELCAAFKEEFYRLWLSERSGRLFPKALFEDQGQTSTHNCDWIMNGLWRDAWLVCGVEMHRRVLTRASIADFQEVEDTALRATLEARTLMMGASLILQADTMPDAAAVCAMARVFNGRDVL
ncbi:MAG: S-methyl-5-thioribose kinase [Pseudomonadota bacterium]